METKPPARPKLKNSMLRKLSDLPILQRLFSHVPPGQFLRYLLVGVWNTGFGYGTFVLFTVILSRPFPKYGYIAAGVFSSVLSITVAFFGYKWFIFRTKGNYLREWLRCMAVYGSSMVLGAFLLPSAVFLIRHLTIIDKNAPYLAAAIITVVNIFYNFLGNKKFSFRTAAAAQPDPPAPSML
jgi:putative flippase GtrA